MSHGTAVKRHPAYFPRKISSAASGRRFKQWSTKAVRDAFFASPQFPRLRNAGILKETFVRGVETGMLAYIGKKPDGTYSSVPLEVLLTVFDVELSEDRDIIQREIAKAFAAGKTTPSAPTQPTPIGTTSTPGAPPPQLRQLCQPFRHCEMERRRATAKMDELLDESPIEVPPPRMD